MGARRDEEGEGWVVVVVRRNALVARAEIFQRPESYGRD